MMALGLPVKIMLIQITAFCRAKLLSYPVGYECAYRQQPETEDGNASARGVGSGASEDPS